MSAELNPKRRLLGSCIVHSKCSTRCWTTAMRWQHDCADHTRRCRLSAQLRSGRHLHHAGRPDRHGPWSLPRKPHLGGLVDAREGRGRIGARGDRRAPSGHARRRNSRCSAGSGASRCRAGPSSKRRSASSTASWPRRSSSATCGSLTGRTSGTALTASAVADGRCLMGRQSSSCGRRWPGLLPESPIASLLSRILSIGQQMRRGCGVSFHQQRT
jgi:hypothetical protein